MSVSIEPIWEEHIVGYHQAVERVARERKYLARTEAPSIEDTRAFTTENMARGNPHYIAVNGSQVVGWCNIVASERHVFAHCGTLGMGLTPEYRGQGIGLRLLRATLAAAEQKGLERVELEVFESNQRATDLYKKVGFQVEGIKVRAARLNGVYENIVLMAMFLSDYEA
jgi:RimJ/RimL family protein N-acetyltransferase